MNAEEIAVRLGGSGAMGQRGYMCLCPVHPDKTPSLSVMDGEDKLLVHCFAGCDGGDVLRELRSLGLIRRRRSPRQKRAKKHIANRDQLKGEDNHEEQPFSCSRIPTMPFDCPYPEYHHLYTKRRQTWRERAIYGRFPWEIETELNEMRAEIMEIHSGK